MKTLIYISILLLLTACNESDSVPNEGNQKDTIAVTKRSTRSDTTTTTFTPVAKFTVIVLPPYDEIANAGTSPGIQKYLETEISKDTSLTLIKFPYRQLMHVPYQNVFDKKFCKPILEKIKTDIIVMSKLDHVTRTGNMTTDKWNFRIRIYNVKTNKQINSTVTGNDLTDRSIKNVLAKRQQNLTTEIKNSR